MWTSGFSLPGPFQCIAFLRGQVFAGEHVLGEGRSKKGVFEGKLISFYFSFLFFCSCLDFEMLMYLAICPCSETSHKV